MKLKQIMQKQNKDNTRTSKPVIDKPESISYEMMGKMGNNKNKNYSKTDSSDYKKGFYSGIKEKSERGYVAGSKMANKTSYVVGLNDRYNEGYTEAKNKQKK